MIQKRTPQLVFQTVYTVLAFLGILCSLGFFNASFNEEFYVYYTNQSNYICAGVMFAALLDTCKKAERGEKGFCTTAPTFTFLSVILILVTFLVYNILLADQSPLEYFTSLSNVLLHCILPLLFFVHWILFYEHGTMRWYHPLLCMIMPFAYVIFILIRAPFAAGNPGAVVYPYFFLNVAELGWSGFFGWIAILLLAFLALGYLFYGLDRLWARYHK